MSPQDFWHSVQVRSSNFRPENSNLILKQSVHGSERDRAHALPRREGTTTENITWKRYEQWRVMRDVGLPNDAGELVRQPVWLIALLFGVSPRTVYDGIALAIRAREDARRRATAVDRET
jgi:hypothetical protein